MNLQLQNGTFYIQKRTFPEWLVFIILIFPFIYGFLTEILYFPGFIRFLIDAIVAFLFLVFLMKKDFVIKRNILPLFTLMVIFFAYTLIVHVMNLQSPFYYLWGFRNNFRFYIAFFAFVSFIKEEYAKQLLKLLDFLFWLNAVISLVQFLFMEVRQDFLGGLFGVTGGTNGYTLLFFSIVITKSLLASFNGVEKPAYCIFKCVISLVIAAMAEMKFYFFVFVFLLIFTGLITRISRRKLIILFASVVGVMVGSFLLTYIFNGSESFLTFEKLLDYATKDHYSSQGDLNRLSAIPTLMRDRVTEPLQQLFGLGLGNCDVSEVSIFNSTFYQQHFYLHYTWFTSAMLFLETGFVGLAIYISFFVVCCVYSIRQLRNGQGNRLFCQMGIVMSVLCVILLFYNASLRTESAYMVYFILSLPFLARYQKGNSLGNERRNAIEK